MGDTVIPFNGTIKSNGKIATIRNDNGTLYFALEKSDIQGTLNSGTNINYSSGTGQISTISTPTFKNVTINTEPSNDKHAATVKYVNDRLQGLDVKESVALATTANIPLTDASLSVDGVSIVDGYRILVKDQTDAKENGIYVVNGGGLTRASDFDNDLEVKGSFVFVERGTVNAAKGFVQSNPDFAKIGQDNITFTQFNGTYAFEAGDGLSKEGNTLNIDSNLNFVTEMTGLTTIGSNEGTIHIASIITGPTITDISGNLSTEVSTARSAELVLTNGLSAEVSRATAVETDISGNLSTEVSTARSAELVLTNGLSTEVSTARSAELVLTNGLSTEVSRATAVETDISGNLSTEVSTARSAELVLTNGLSTEVSRATAAEGILNTSINESGVTITSVTIKDLSGVFFSNDASFNNVSGPQPAGFSMDFSGNLIVNLNSFFFRYSIYDVSSGYNGVVHS
jgi:hypothetical protein